jgi:hypothetical protein
MGPGAVIDASTYAYAIESSELLFITLGNGVSLFETRQ